MKLKLLVWNELRTLSHQSVLKWMSALLLLFWIVAISISISEYEYEEQTRNGYKQHHRELWLQQFPKNPHMAAHFGTFVFKPANPLSIFDKGISNYSGTFMYLEAHRQNDFVCTPAQNASVHIRMGELDLSFLLQYGIPLLIICIAASMCSTDKQNGLLEFIRANAVSIRSVLYAKAIALCILLLILLSFIFAGTLLISFCSGIKWNLDQLLLAAMLFLSYALFYMLMIFLFLIISIKAASFKQAFIISCFSWVVLFFILPKLIASAADTIYQLPSNLAFKDEIRKDIDKGINGHAHGDREQKIIDSILNYYQVDSTHKLPVNIDGILLKTGEQYSADVYNHHFQHLNHTIMQQQNTTRVSGLVDPFLSIRNISLALCRNDITDEYAFRQQAEKYRLYFVQLLNDNMTLYSKEHEFDTYKISSKAFEDIVDFQYESQKPAQAIQNCAVDVIMLLLFIGGLQLYMLKRI